MDFAYIGTIILLILGFGFVVFWHELGHFLAAKWAGVKVEQFAIGFGTAIGSWRKGMGFRWGSSGREYEQMLRSDFAAANVGETEYRLNWLPLGGYVKMLGQDDMRPGAAVDDPRSYTNKSIGKRMVIVSAGVIMNVILAAILFMVLFLHGFNAPPAVVGAVQIGSPAQRAVRPDGTPAPLQVGDRILYFDDQYQHDFTKITLAVALAGPGQTEMYVRRADGTEERLLVTPTRAPGESAGFVMLGVSPSPVLRGPDPKKLTDDARAVLADQPVRPGETIVAINGRRAENVEDYHLLDRAVQESFGQPVELTVRTLEGAEETRTLHPEFGMTFGNQPLSFGGMVPRAVIGQIYPGSDAAGKLQRGDVIESITVVPQNDTIHHPTIQQVTEVLGRAGANGLQVDMTVLREGETEPLRVAGLNPNRKLPEQNRRGLGIGLNVDVRHPVVGDVVENSPAAKAGVVEGARLTSIDGRAVSSWFEVHRLLATREANQPASVEFVTPLGEQRTAELPLDAEALLAVQQIRYSPDLALDELRRPRKTNNPAQAAWWGVTETRDLIVQFYLTLQRMIQGTVSPTNLMGPLGIVDAGSKIAYKGTDWLIWFLAMISANLAVVNFLPIPIVDGGLFVFLILEKLMGRPLSPRAQSIAQIVGLALILSVFLFVTYQDINRIF